LNIFIKLILFKLKQIKEIQNYLSDKNTERIKKLNCLFEREFKYITSVQKENNKFRNEIFYHYYFLLEKKIIVLLHKERDNAFEELIRFQIKRDLF